MNKLIYFFLKRIACLFVFNALYRVKTTGLKNIPKHGKVILASNHASFLDPMTLFHVIPRRHRAITAGFLFKFWWLSWAFKATDCIPTDNLPIEQALGALNNKEAVLIFPEGKCRGGKKQVLCRNPKKGAVVLALKTGAPVVPIAIKGTFEAWPVTRLFPYFFKKLHVHIGSPLHFEKYKGKEIPIDALRKNLKLVMGEIKKLLTQDSNS